MGRALKTSLGWMAIVLVAFVLASVFSAGSRAKQTSFTELEQYIENDEVESAVITGYNFKGRFRLALEETSPSGQTRVYTEFVTVLPYVDSDLVAQWQEADLRFEFREESPGWFDYLWSAWPILLLVVFWLFIMRRMQGGGMGGPPGGIFNFGKSKAKLFTSDKSKVTFADVAGADEAKQELEEIIEFLKNPDKFTKLGGKIPKGALLLGPPGTGKTLLARAVAGEAGVPYFSLSGADFVEMFVGVGASRVRDLFAQAKKAAPAIIFIDEIDAVGRHRGAGLGGGHDEREQTLNQLLVEMDGFETNEGVILLAATNRPDVLDSALLRPGRLDRQIVVDRPDIRGREGILKVHTKKVPLDADVDLRTLARGTPGLAGADLANLVNEAALLAARYDQTKVTMQNFEDAKDKVMMGAERRSLIISEKEKKQTAYHEAGHVLVSLLVPESDPIHKVTIIPRGRALGVTHSLPIDERHTYSREYCLAVLAKAMGGRVAEKLVFKTLSTGAGNDIEQASSLARKMVCEWGMSDKLGPVAFGKKQEEIFLAREIAQHRDYSDATATVIDEEVHKLIVHAEKQGEVILKENEDKLHALAEALLEREILDSSEIEAVMQGKILKPLKKPDPPTYSGNGAKEPEADATPDAQADSETTPESPDTTGSDDGTQDTPTAPDTAGPDDGAQQQDTPTATETDAPRD
ncbi:MAG: ATP-dependent zinc metalloprotease FtsH [Candidatus Marinimicrobia bacterium]|nr:ATP-dependent zinc metalloprotease FtsH [Candidatus Neomarinimicrobiota bacterium]